MRTTLNIDPDLLRKAAKLTGITEKTSLVRQGLEALIARESARRLAALGGTESKLRPVPRRRRVGFPTKVSVRRAPCLSRNA
jgi:Arc/MetJ family transcription regulator